MSFEIEHVEIETKKTHNEEPNDIVPRVPRKQLIAVRDRLRLSVGERRARPPVGARNERPRRVPDALGLDGCLQSEMTDDLDDSSSSGENDASDGSKGVDSDEASRVLRRRRGGEEGQSEL